MPTPMPLGQAVSNSTAATGSPTAAWAVRGPESTIANATITPRAAHRTSDRHNLLPIGLASLKFIVSRSVSGGDSCSTISLTGDQHQTLAKLRARGWPTMGVPIRQEVPMQPFGRCLGAALLASVLAAAPAAADDQEQHQHPRPEKLGTVVFPTSCAPAVQARFARAVALLHSFWYDEAEKAFGEVAAADPSCAMAQWGVAMSLYHPIWAAPTPAGVKRGQEGVAKA